MNDDRVTELYLGELEASERTREVCRDRIHWVVSQLAGTVLDIGASQGIVSVLAGRAGHEVTGVEIEEPAIAYARAFLAKEPAAVQRRVRFVNADIYGDALRGKFDTVVLGEILEHLAEPRTLFLRAAEFVAPGGRIVGTTPFGLHPHPDHRTTFYLRSFVDTIAGFGTPTHLEIVEGFIRFVIQTERATSAELGPEALLAQSEREFLRIQVAAEDHRVSKVELSERQSARIKDLHEKWQYAQSQAATSRTEAIEAKRELAALRKQLSELERFTEPPDGASPPVRGFSALLGSLLREINTGGLREAPLQALRKTYARVRRELSAVSRSD